MARWLYDTSVVIALETSERIADLPVGEYAVSVITIGELEVGVHLAKVDDLSLRLELIAEIEHSWNPLPVDVRVVRRYASLIAECRRRGVRPSMGDALIAATASVHGMGIVARDHDFLQFKGLEVVIV
jgi:predicted nucleic acid-binding protein